MIKVIRLIKLCLKNIYQYKRNKFIMFSIGFSAFFMVFGGGYSDGMKSQLLQLMYRSYTGDFTVVSKNVELKSSPSPIQVGWDEMIINRNNIVEKVMSIKNVHVALRRLVLFANVMGDDQVENEFSIIVGCEFDKEENYAFNNIELLDEYSTDGEIVYINEKIAKKLNLKFGDDIYLFFVGKYGMPIPTKFKVGGLFRGRGFPAVTEKLVYIDYDILKDKIKLKDDMFTYLMIFTDNKNHTIQTLSRLKDELFPDLKIVSPHISGKFFIDIHKTISFSSRLSNSLMYLIIFLFIYSTLILSTYSRRRELGIMSALGLSKRRIFWILSGEGMLLGLIPTIIGAGLGLLSVLILSRIGIPAVGEAMRYMFASDVLYFKVNLLLLVRTIFLICVISFLGSVSPILKLLRLKPVEALQENKGG